MTTRTLFSTLLILALPLLMLGCDGGGSAMEEPQQMEELKLSIYHPPESGNAQTNVTIDRSASELETGDLLNVFARGNANSVSREAIGVEYPTEGNTAEVAFTVPAGNYNVDLLGYNASGDKNSAVVFATTGDDGSVNVTSGNVTEVRFDQSGDVLTKFDLSFSANLEFRGNGNSSRQLDVTLETIDGNGNTDLSTLAADLFGSDGSYGQIGIDPDPNAISDFTPSDGRDNAAFTSRSGATLSTDKNALNLPPGQYKDGTASVLLELEITDELIGSGDPVYLYNNEDGTAEDGISLFEQGDGGIIVII
jgi:hypothetical protein